MATTSTWLNGKMQTVDAEYGFGVEFDGKQDVNVMCPWHEDEDSKSKSCSVSVRGVFSCKGCGQEGDIFDFYAQANGMRRSDAIAALGGTGDPQKRKALMQSTVKTKRELSESDVDSRIESLHEHAVFFQYMTDMRGISASVIDKHRIGADEHRICLPVYDELGELVNIRRYRPNGTPKMLSFAEGYGSPQLYPARALQECAVTDWLILCEGEWDALLLESKGFHAITITAGVQTWSHAFTQALANRCVTVLYDVNDKPNKEWPEGNVGQIMAQRRAATLNEFGCTTKVVTLPIDDVGGDVTDYFMKHKRTVDDFQKLLDDTEVCTLTLSDAPSQTKRVSLREAAAGEYYNQPLEFSSVVAGKATSPFIVPQAAKVSWVDAEGERHDEHTYLDLWDPRLIQLINISNRQLKQFMREYAGVPAEAKHVKVTVTQALNIEETWLIPTLDMDVYDHQYTLRQAFFMGKDFATNTVYTCTGYTTPHPRNQQVSHVVTKAEPSTTSIDTFELSEADVQELSTAFKCDHSVEAVAEKHGDIVSHLAAHVTHIYGRADLHKAIDLVYHSALLFEYDNMKLRKGWLELLVIGDTRTGKGMVAESLSRHYKAGEVVSGENVSIPGLVGAVQKLGDSWSLVWGKIPLADRQLLCIDECGGLSVQDIAKLSRVRSEGLAEITKVVTEKTTARARLIWLGNPRSNESVSVSDYNYGIETVPELIGTAEDVARFDMALIVDRNEVDGATINDTREQAPKQRYTSDMCHKLVMWAWSRRSEHIAFTDNANAAIRSHAKQLASRYSPRIPLVQIEDIRFKIARLAVATAVRVFSTVDGVNLLVHTHHVEYAVQFLDEIYSKPASSYRHMSSVDKERESLRDTETVRALVLDLGSDAEDFVTGMLQQRQIGAKDVCDYTAITLWDAKSLVSALVRERALEKQHSYYVKRPAFNDLLQDMKKELAQKRKADAFSDEEV